MALFRIRPASESGTYTGWSLGAGASKVIAVDPGPSFTDDDATSYIESTGAPDTTAKQGFVMGTRPEVATITDIAIRARCQQTAGPNMTYLAAHFRLRGVNGDPYALLPVNNLAWITVQLSFFSLTNGRPGGGLWTINDIFDPTLEVVVYVADWAGNNTGQKMRCSTIWVEVTGTGTPSQLLQAREIASRRLRLRRRPQRIFTLKNVGPAALDIDPLGEFALTHQAVPNAGGAGAGDLVWQRRILRAIGQSPFNLDTLSFDTFTAMDLRRLLVTFWDTGIASRPGPTAPGVARWDIGCTRSFTRASKAWLLDAGLVVREVNNDEESLGRAGMLIRRPHTNYLIQSSFRNGSGSTFTGWTFADGSGSHAEDTADLLFDPNIAGRSLKLTAGNPHGTETTATSTTTGTIPANTVVSVTVDYNSSVTGSGAWAWRLQRGVDSKWWDGSAWQVAQQTNNVNPLIANNHNTLFALAISVGASNTTLTLTLLLPAGGTVSRIIHFYHAQICDLPYFNGRILTDAAAVTLAQERLLISNNATARFWRRNSGTLQIRFASNWQSGASVSGYTFTIASCVFDANNGMWIYYDGTNSQWVFKRRAGGTDYLATKSVGVFIGTVGTVVTTVITARWTGSDGELGLANRTQSIFVDGVKGTDVISVPPTQTATANAAFGGEETTSNTADGEISGIVATEQVLTDQEIGWAEHVIGSIGSGW